MRSVLAVTGIRSEYDIASSVLSAIQANPALRLQLVVTGAHLSPTYGMTVREIEADSFSIAERIENLIESDAIASRVKGMGVQLAKLSDTVERLKPTFLLVVGDREESMTTALVGAYTNTLVAHIGGGDRVVGNVDDQVRHAVTKLAHLHFATNKESHDRILRLGEQPFRVFNSGNPGLDRLLATPVLSDEALSKELGFEVKTGEHLLLVIQHSLSTEVPESGSQMRTTLEAAHRLGVKTVIVYPNSDPGSHAIIEAIESFRHVHTFHTVRNLSRVPFVNIMRRASCLVGNSSAGIVEAPLLKLPVVNTGNRQKGRLHAENVEFVAHDLEAIESAVRRALYDASYRERVSRCSNPYGDGHSGRRIAETLATIPLTRELLVKDLTY